jgi:xanthine dehydrogenase molybdopterin-binding subunit B
MLALSAFHALRDAVASVGDYRVVPRLDAPATPERVLRAVSRRARTRSHAAPGVAAAVRAAAVQARGDEPRARPGSTR